MAKKKDALTPEQRLQEALVPESEWPYKVPENWCWTHLGNYIDFATDYVANGSFASLKENVQIFKEKNYALMVKTQDFATGFTQSLTYTDKHGYDFLKKSVLFGGELILSNIGSVGKVFRVPYLEIPMTLASNSIMIKCYTDLDYDWIYYYLLSPLGNELLLSITTGTAVLKFNKTDLKTIPLPVIPRYEQQRIVDRIESLFVKLDEAKQKAQDVVDGFETRKAAILHKAFTGELTEKWRNLKLSINSKWIYKTLNETSIDIIDGDRGPNYPKKDEFSSEGYCVFLNTKNVTKQGFNFETVEFITAEKDAVLRKGKLVRDDIVLTTRGTIGNIAYYDESIPYNNMRINSGMVIYRHGNEFYKPYLIFLYKSDVVLNQIKKMQTGSAQPQLPIKIMKELQLPIPALEEQKEIVRILDDLLSKEQQAKEAAEAVLEQIDLIKKSILARAFRGELGTNDPTEESAVELLKEILEKEG